jgi:hypothetical protein
MRLCSCQTFSHADYFEVTCSSAFFADYLQALFRFWCKFDSTRSGPPEIRKTTSRALQLVKAMMDELYAIPESLLYHARAFVFLSISYIA